MSHKEKLNSFLQEMMKILLPQNGHSEQNNDIGVINEEAKQKLVHLVLEMQATVATMPDTKQSQSSGFFSSFPSPFGSSKAVQVFMPVATSTSKDFAAAMTKLCKEMSFKCEIPSCIEEIKRDLPLLVVCPTSSRFQPDIDHALQGLAPGWPSPFIALVMHSCTENSLPRLPTATRLTNKEQYRHAEFIDIAFTMESSIYPCKMNSDAKAKLKAFLDRHYKK